MFRSARRFLSCLVFALPGLAHAYTACVGTAGNGLADCELVRSPTTTQLADWLHQQVTTAGLTWVDPVPLVCSGSSCPAAAAGIGMYSDASHITRTWSTHLATALEELLDDAGAFTG